VLYVTLNVFFFYITLHYWLFFFTFFVWIMLHFRSASTEWRNGQQIGRAQRLEQSANLSAWQQPITEHVWSGAARRWCSFLILLLSSNAWTYLTLRYCQMVTWRRNPISNWDTARYNVRMALLLNRAKPDCVTMSLFALRWTPNQFFLEYLQPVQMRPVARLIILQISDQ